MSERVKRIAQNVGLAAGSLLLTFALLELVVFRFILEPDDLLPNVTLNGVVRYVPGTNAVFRHPDGRNTLVTINADGWNSTHRRYPVQRAPGMLRVAVIGDSYVHGSFVDVHEGFPEVLERQLNGAGLKAEVFRFGMDGAPLSQYLHVLRKEVKAYRPDVVIVPLIHNDFDESYRVLKTRYASSFMKVTSDDAGRAVEIEPADFRPGIADMLRNFRTFRYLYYKTNAYLVLKSYVSRLFWGGNEDWAPEFVSSAVDIRRINDHTRNRFFARYILRQMQALAKAEGFKLVLAMDGVREAIYEGRPPFAYEVGRLNRIAAEVTTELGLPFIDLQQTFAADWEKHHLRFEFPYDWHWNAHANALVGRRLADFLLADPALLGRQPRAAASERLPKGS